MSAHYFKTWQDRYLNGEFHDNLPPNLYLLDNQVGLRCIIMDIGATILSIEFRNKQGIYQELLISEKNWQNYNCQSAYLGATIGRFSNRIKSGSFQLNNNEYQPTQNNNGNTLHGGVTGFDKKRGQLIHRNKRSITFKCFSPHLDEGFPGNLSLYIQYEITMDNRLVIRYQGKCDQACPISITNHCYFNLGDHNTSILNHQLQINSNHYLEMDAQIPTGKIIPVTSCFDFTKKKAIRHNIDHEELRESKGYDHCYIVNDDKKATAQLFYQDIALCIRTSYPSLQIYTGNYLSNTSSYVNNMGISIEPQFLPDGPNHPEWEKKYRGIFERDEVYHQFIEYKFKLV